MKHESVHRKEAGKREAPRRLGSGPFSLILTPPRCLSWERLREGGRESRGRGAART